MHFLVNASPPSPFEVATSIFADALVREKAGIFKCLITLEFWTQLENSSLGFSESAHENKWKVQRLLTFLCCNLTRHVRIQRGNKGSVPSPPGKL